MEVLNPAAIHGEAVAGRSATVRKQLLRMVSNMAVSTFDFIELIAEAQENNYAPQWGFSSTVDYGTKELGLKKRKIQYLARIGKVAKEVGLTRSQFEPAGVSKLRVITTLEPDGTFWNKDTHANEDLAEHIVRLILDSDKMNLEQVEDEVARLRGQSGPDRRVVRSYTTDITTWTNVISAAIEKARKYLGSKGRDGEGNAVEYTEGACYECICAAFNADPNYEEDPGDITMEQVLEVSKAPQTLPMESI